jgi:hypothetical protein
VSPSLADRSEFVLDGILMPLLRASPMLLLIGLAEGLLEVSPSLALDLAPGVRSLAHNLGLIHLLRLPDDLVTSLAVD